MNGDIKMNFIKKLVGQETKGTESCCRVEIKEVEDTKEKSCCGTSNNETSCCN